MSMIRCRGRLFKDLGGVVALVLMFAVIAPAAVAQDGTVIKRLDGPDTTVDWQIRVLTVRT